MPSLVHAAVGEMWARAISSGGGVISSDVLACYRVHGSTIPQERSVPEKTCAIS